MKNHFLPSVALLLSHCGVTVRTRNARSAMRARDAEHSRSIFGAVLELRTIVMASTLTTTRSEISTGILMTSHVKSRGTTTRMNQEDNDVVHRQALLDQAAAEVCDRLLAGDGAAVVLVDRRLALRCELPFSTGASLTCGNFSLDFFRLLFAPASPHCRACRSLPARRHRHP